MKKLLLFSLLAGPLAAQAPTVRLIAAPDAQSKPLFGIVPAVRPLPGGKLLVNDIMRRQLTLLDQNLASTTLVADSTAGIANTYGTTPGGVIPYLGDSTLFVQPAELSMFVLDPAGKIARVASVPRSQDARAIGNNMSGAPALDAKGRLVYRGGMNISRVGRGAEPGKAGISAPEFPDTAAIVRIDLASRKVDTVAWFKIPKVKMSIERTDNGVSMRSETNPLPITDDFAVLANGNVAIVRGQDYHVDFVTPDGEVIKGSKIPFDWQRLSDDDKVAVIDSVKKAGEAMRSAMANGGDAAMVAGLAGAVGGGGQRVVMNFSTGGDGGGPPRVSTGGAGMAQMQFVSPSELPDYRPAFMGSAVRGDEDGNVWVRTTAVRAAGSVSGPIYDVINSRGELIDRIQIPAGRQIVGFGKGGVVYMAARDASGSWIERTHR